MSTTKFNYPTEPLDHPVTKLLDPEFAAWLEGYAVGISHLQKKLTGENFCGKSYDPLTVDGLTLWSYAFDLRDSGRRHSATLYQDIGALCNEMLNEVAEDIDDTLYQQYR